MVLEFRILGPRALGSVLWLKVHKWRTPRGSLDDMRFRV